MLPESVLVSVVFAPAIAFLLLGVSWLAGVTASERFVARLTCFTFLWMTIGSAWLGLTLLGANAVTWDGGIWFHAGEYEFLLGLFADRLSVPLMLMSAILVGLVGSFSQRYMHREPGFLRFYLLLNLFAFGAMLIFASASFDLLIGGWELVGISSALLVAFFHQRREPVESALYVFSAYRLGDLGLLLGVFVLHYFAGSSDDSHLFPGVWPVQGSTLGPVASVLTAMLFLIAAAAKSAQIPFSGWLPRAMEGPTPSSAIFYGAISVHAGAYLLLRIEPIFGAYPLAAAMVVAVGGTSALIGTLLHRAAPDAKTSIAYSAMTQLGLIFAEIGLGFPRLALIHILGHAAVRTLQFLRAPSVLYDYHRVHAASGGDLGRTGAHLERLLPESMQLRLYRMAVDRAFVDVFVERFLVHPLFRLSHWLGQLEPRTSSEKAARQETMPLPIESERQPQL